MFDLDVKKHLFDIFFYTAIVFFVHICYSVALSHRFVCRSIYHVRVSFYNMHHIIAFFLKNKLLFINGCP